MASGKEPTPADRYGSRSVQSALQHYIGHAPLPFAITRGAEHVLVYANSTFCQLAGLADCGALGAPIGAAFSGPAGLALSAVLDQAFLEAIEHLDSQVDALGPEGRAWQCTVWPIIATDGTSEGLGLQFRERDGPHDALDLQRQIAERMLLGALRERGLAEDAEAARRRAAFLAEAGRMLAESADRASTLVVLTRLALPTLDSWCIVDLLEDGGAVQRLGIFHPDPAKQSVARQLEVGWRPEAEDAFGVAPMLRNPQTIAVTDDIEAVLLAGAHNPENLGILRRLGVGALLSVPLIARGTLLGAVTFVSAERGPHSKDDVRLAEDLAHLGSLALDNAQLYDKAVTAQRGAETANRAKTAFLGAMSHELRTPLNAIGGYVDIMDMGLRGPLTDEQRADLARVKSNQQHLMVIITEILNYAHLGSGHVSYNLIDFSADELLIRAVELVEPLIDARGLVCERQAIHSAVVANGDPEKVIQILVNLLSNAIKFTPRGGSISVRSETRGEVVQFHVKDTGIGIREDHLETIFEPFVQLKDGLANRDAGVGLGLAISRDLARGMNGDLTLTSDEGKGAHFILTIPAAEGAQP